ncbi:MAG: NACHT domain-containing protein [Acidobacteria bacterium]|nr:NACHT domain-containing protein [Acidobacteriota bacterium]
MTIKIKPETISRRKKERFLLAMSEDKFRDEVLRPLFLRQGLKDGRDFCGPSEQGKDAGFISIDQLGSHNLYVVQTKKGNLNLAKEAKSNVIEAVTQLRTALATHVVFLAEKQKRLPSKAILCASGKINSSARQHIAAEIQDPRFQCFDSDDLIPKIDEFYPELWYGIDAELYPYLRFIKRMIEESSDEFAIADLFPATSDIGPATQPGYVQLTLYRTVLKIRKHKGKVSKEPDFQQCPINVAIKRHDTQRASTPVLILGDAGAGKSTALKRLAYILATKGLESGTDYDIPIILRALDVAKATCSFVELCDSYTRKLIDSKKPVFSANDLKNGNLTIFIDALDEVADEQGRAHVVGPVTDFHAEYPNCRLVLTSRNYTFIQEIDALKDFDTYRISPISHKEAGKIIQALQRGKTISLESARETVRRLEEIHGMELNPLLVTIFASTCEYSRRDIPANITELFKKYTEMMLGRWDESKGMAKQYHAPLKDFLLKTIAFEMHRRRTIQIDLHEYERIIEMELAKRGHQIDINQMLEETLNRSGLFRIIGDTVEFRHLLLQEFFAGRGIQSSDYLNAVIADEWWKRAIVFYYGDRPSEFATFENLISSLTSRPLEENFRAALTLGLALQACYLVEVDEKIRLIQWVIDTLGRAKSEFLQCTDPSGKYPLTRFLFYYLFGRDSVALSVLNQRIEQIVAELVSPHTNQDEKDIRMFWLIVGLIEGGSLQDADELIRHYKPSDPRLLLGIHLGCNLIQHLRVSTTQQVAIAKKITDRLGADVQHLRVQLLSELKSELLEERGGKIKAIDAKGVSIEESSPTVS